MIEAVEFKNINKKYVVSSDGLIWRILSDGDITMINLTIDKFGKKRVIIFSSGVYKVCCVHKLILGAFLGIADREVIPLDGNYSNTSLSNLVYKNCTRK